MATATAFEFPFHRLYGSSYPLKAGNLYFANPDQQLLSGECAVLKEQVVRNFRSIGITFLDASIISSQWPRLEQLDMLIYIVNEPIPESPVMAFFGIKNEFRYHELREKYGFPYSELESVAHTGLVCPLSYIKFLESNPRIKIDSSSREDLLGWTVQTVTHEIGHGLGASHVRAIIGLGYGVKYYENVPHDFMSRSPASYQGLSFCDENIYITLHYMQKYQLCWHFCLSCNT